MKKVLIVDDNEVVIDTLRKGFEKYKAHFQPVFALSGLETMNILNEDAMSLVVTDIQMPMVDGLVLLEFIRERYPKLPCIIMSSYGSDELKEEVKNQVVQFLDKPVNISTLAQLIISELNNSNSKQIDRMEISDFVNIIIQNKKTCIFKIIPENGPSGIYYFNNGDLYNVVCGTLKGEGAVVKTLSYENAKVIFTKPPKNAGPKSVNIDLQKLIQQARSSNLSISVKQLSAGGKGR